MAGDCGIVDDVIEYEGLNPRKARGFRDQGPESPSVGQKIGLSREIVGKGYERGKGVDLGRQGLIGNRKI